MVKLADRLDVMAAVRAAFVEVAAGGTQAAPVLRAPASAPDQAINVKFAAAGTLVGGKIGTYWPDNVDRGLDNHCATTILLDPDTGFPAAFIAARTLNRLRTAAGNAIATEALSRPDSRILALVGAGAQSVHEARAIARVRDLDEIRIGARDPDRAAATAHALEPLGISVRICSIADAVAGADLIVTITSAREPLVRSEWVGAGTHISAMGADAKGKQELAPELTERATLFADWPDQSLVIGELQHGHRLGLFTRDAVTAIGDVLSGATPVRRSASDITLFDSSGLAVQDLHVAHAALEAARAAGLVEEVAF